MSKFFPQTVQASTYTRAYKVISSNPMQGNRQLTCLMEQVTIVGDEVTSRPAGEASEVLTDENRATEFPLLDVAGNPTGKTMSYGELEQAIVSSALYIMAKRESEKEVIV